MDLAQKSADAKNPAARLACRLALEKRSNLFLGLDVADKAEFQQILEQCAGEIVGIKTHVDIIEGFEPSWWAQVLDTCRDNGLLVFEDRKFADVGKTVRLQYEKGIYRISDWANLVTCHAVAGPGTLEGLEEVARGKRDSLARGVLLLAQMTGTGTLATGDYTRSTVRIAQNHLGFCAGYIGNASDVTELKALAKLVQPGTLIFAPGVRLDSEPGILGQRHSTPRQAVGAGADFIIVSSGICKSADPARAAKEYRAQGWTGG